MLNIFVEQIPDRCEQFQFNWWRVKK